MRRYTLTIAAALAALTAAAPANAAPRIVSATVQGTPLVDETLTVVVVAVDKDAAVNAVHVGYPGDGGGFGSSACLIRPDGSASTAGAYAPGREVRFELPFRPSSAGAQKLDVSVTSGACGGDEHTTSTTVSVPVALPDVAAVPTIVPPRARASASQCANTGAVPGATNAALIRAAVTCLFNVERVARGLPLLHTERHLRTAAGRHSRDMVRRGFFDHQGPDGPSFAARLQRARYWPATAAENIGEASGDMGTPASMVDAWMHSDLHRTNILTAAFRQIGLGIAPRAPGGSSGSTYTADFGRR